MLQIEFVLLGDLSMHVINLEAQQKTDTVFFLREFVVLRLIRVLY